TPCDPTTPCEGARSTDRDVPLRGKRAGWIATAPGPHEPGRPHGRAAPLYRPHGRRPIAGPMKPTREGVRSRRLATEGVGACLSATDRTRRRALPCRPVSSGALQCCLAPPGSLLIMF